MKNGKKKKYTSLLPQMAVSNIRKNASTYLPYIVVSIFAMFTYFSFDLLLHNEIMRNLPKGAYTLMLVGIGFSLLGIIMIPFLYYTNSFLIKRRKKELGLYSMLGLEKKHIGIMMFWESLIVYVVVLTAAIILGLVFSRLIFLLLLNLAKMPVDVSFSISPTAITDSLGFYAFITVLNLVVNLIQVGRANPVELMSDSRKGEKEPRHIWLWSVIGACALAAGYRMALCSQLESQVFIDFFFAVFLVVIGTYFLFTSGSIAILRFLKSRKKLYYRSSNFITISGMLYRMKKNAASLSNICIFSTMVIITAVCTVTVWMDMDKIVSSTFSRMFEIQFCGDASVDVSHLQEDVEALAAQYQVMLEDTLIHDSVILFPYKEGDVFHNGNKGDQDFRKIIELFMMTPEEYEALDGTAVSLEPDQVLLFTTGPDFAYGTAFFQDYAYQVKEEVSFSRLGEKARNNTLENRYLAVFSDASQIQKVCAAFDMDSTVSHTHFYGFAPKGGDIDAFSQALAKYLTGQRGFIQYEDNREVMSDQESMYGGLLFIGIFFGAIFLICLLIIMYYKQITEGFEDQKNFEVMQQVGMSDREIRRTIRTQIRIVFGFPLIGAIVHTAVGMRMVYMLLGAIGFFEMTLLIACTAGGCLIFALIYSYSYKRTSLAYYRIVKQMH